MLSGAQYEIFLSNGNRVIHKGKHKNQIPILNFFDISKTSVYYWQSFRYTMMLLGGSNHLFDRYGMSSRETMKFVKKYRKSIEEKQINRGIRSWLRLT